MSRGEELRKKFAAKAAANPFDEKRADFVECLDRFLAVEKHASAASTSFIDKLYAEFKAEQPVDIGTWFSSKLDKLFISVKQKPTWIFEPSWVFDDGVPLEFLHQFSDEDGVAFYVFRGYRKAELPGVSGKRRFLRMTAQTRHGLLHLEGDVTG